MSYVQNLTLLEDGVIITTERGKVRLSYEEFGRLVAETYEDMYSFEPELTIFMRDFFGKMSGVGGIT